MLNKLEALRHFCVAAETLNFRETAVRLAVSPQVVSRMIAELESAVGEVLFKRNSRTIRLTAFGEQFLPRAKQLLEDAELLFTDHARNDSHLAGVVRITLPRLPFYAEILGELCQQLRDYPDIVLEWYADSARLKLTEHQIDMGVRVGLSPEPDWVVRPITEMRQRIVAAPELAARCGLPENLEDLQRRYPLSSQINQETGRPWGWYFNEQQNFIPRRPALAATDGYSELAAALSGRVCAFILDGICQSELTAGKLIELLPDIPRQTWQLYLYRPYHSITPQRVLLVFDLLTQILQRYFPAVKNTMPV